MGRPAVGGFGLSGMHIFGIAFSFSQSHGRMFGIGFVKTGRKPGVLPDFTPCHGRGTPLIREAAPLLGFPPN